MYFRSSVFTDVSTLKGGKNTQTMNFLLNFFKKSDANSRHELTLILLGTSYAGKTTLVNHAKLLFGGGFDKNDAQLMKNLVHANILHETITIAKALQKLMYSQLDFKFNPERRTLFLQIVPRLCKARELELNSSFQNYKSSYTRELHKDVVWLWKTCTEFKQFAEKNCKLLRIPDGNLHYFANLSNYDPSTFLLSRKDVLYSRIRTAGVYSTSVLVNSTKCTLFDGLLQFLITMVTSFFLRVSKTSWWISCK